MSIGIERLDRLLSRLGYGSRRDVAGWVRQGWIEHDGMPVASPSEKVDPLRVRLRGEALDHPEGLTVIYHKPVGTICSRREQGRLIYDDFPKRWRHRKPAFVPVGRLDKETSGLLIVTDDGQLNHHLTSPRHRIGKRYRVQLASPLRGDEVERFACGDLHLRGEDAPCLPAKARALGPREMELVIFEGRYHQVRRMFAAVGNRVIGLQRVAIGALTLGELAPGAFQVVDSEALLQQIHRG